MEHENQVNNEWISTKDRLPEEGFWVLAHIVRDNWKDANDPDGVYYKVVSLQKGISLEDRKKMKDGQLPDPVEIGITFWDDKQQVHHDRRSSVYTNADEGGNNLRPYRWQEFGPGQYWGQEVDYWRPIPRL